jgi:hypothetical protein
VVELVFTGGNHAAQNAARDSFGKRILRTSSSPAAQDDKIKIQKSQGAEGLGVVGEEN